jgi:hypothetical protein
MFPQATSLSYLIAQASPINLADGVFIERP